MTNQTVKKALQDRPLWTPGGSGQTLWRNLPNAHSSNSISDNHIFFAAWNMLVIGVWDSVDIIVNPYTQSQDSLPAGEPEKSRIGVRLGVLVLCAVTTFILTDSRASVGARLFPGSKVNSRPGCWASKNAKQRKTVRPWALPTRPLVDWARSFLLSDAYRASWRCQRLTCRIGGCPVPTERWIESSKRKRVQSYQSAQNLFYPIKSGNFVALQKMKIR